MKSSTDEWEKYAEELKVGAERRAKENERARVGDGVEGDTMMEALGAIGLNESDSKYNGVVMERFIDQLCEETFRKFCDSISGEVVHGELIKEAREAEMETFKKHVVYEKVPLEKCWKVTWRAPVGMK